LAQNPGVDKFLVDHPGVYNDLVKHDNARRFFENNPKITKLVAENPQWRRQTEQAREYVKNTTKEQRENAKQKIKQTNEYKTDRAAWKDATPVERKEMVKQGHKDLKNHIIKRRAAR